MAGGRTGGYGEGTPWVFTGRALYQLHLVKADVAQPFIPPELKLVQAFGYTLGGLYLARYNGSPAGVFDELVVIAGIVWNPPTSCAWAAKVLVNSEEACNHGRKEVGLPSQFAKFSQTSSLTVKKQPAWKNVASKLFRPWRNAEGQPPSSKTDFCNFGLNIQVEEGQQHPLCHISLPQNTVIQNELLGGWKGPSIKMSLPSFSGKTSLQPQLLKYSCDLSCRIRVVAPAAVTTTGSAHTDSKFIKEPGVRTEMDSITGVQAILMSKPIFAMHFDDMFMGVEAPTVVAPSKGTSSPDVSSAGVLQPAFANRK